MNEISGLGYLGTMLDFGVFPSIFGQNGIINEKILDEWTNSKEIYAYIYRHGHIHTYIHIYKYYIHTLCIKLTAIHIYKDIHTIITNHNHRYIISLWCVCFHRTREMLANILYITYTTTKDIMQNIN